MISQVESCLCSDKQGTPEEFQRIQHPKCCVSTYHTKDEDNSRKNHNQNKKLDISVLTLNHHQGS